MNEHNFHNHDFDNNFETIGRVVSLIVSVFTGLWTYFEGWTLQIPIPTKEAGVNIDLPVHNIHYFPEIRELIPPLIVASCSCLLVFMLNKLLNHVWNRVFGTDKK